MEESSEKSLLVRLFTAQHRYIFGLLIFIFLLGGALFLAWIVPGQLTTAEKSSALASATVSFLDPSAKNVIDLPYLLLQKASLSVLGITELGIKLPSLIIGALTGLGILWLLRSWLLRSSIALFSGVIAITSSQFLFVASHGTPLVMPLFWIVVLLLLALKLSANHRSLAWGLGVAVVFGLSLYTPLVLYLLISLLLAIILHPHLRHLLRTIPKKNILISLLVFLVIVAPLVIALYKLPSLAATFIGWPGSGQSLGQVKFNGLELLKSYFFFWRPDLTPMGLTPIFGLGSLCLIAFGAIKLIADHHAARSYSLAVLLPILLVPVLLQPRYNVILFVPFILLLAIGIEALLDEWYKLFPHNPYARVVALVPVMILLAGLVISNVGYHVNGYRYHPNLSRNYSQDLRLVRGIVTKYSGATMVVSVTEKPFYDLLRRDFPKLKISDHYPRSSAAQKQTVIVSANSEVPVTALDAPRQVVSDSYRTHEPRFYVFVVR